MFVGYAENHKGGVYRMWNPKMRKIHITRDVIFLKRMLFQTTVDEVSVVPSVTQDFITLDARESTHETEPTDAGSETSGGDESEDHSASNPDSDNDNNDGEPNDGATGEWQTARSGRTSRMPSRYRTDIGAAAIISTECERNYYSLLLDENDYEDCEEEDEEIACVGAGLGGGFQSTKELHVMKYKQAMKTKDKDMWTEAVFEEHDRMVKREVWRTELKKDVTKVAKILTSTWATKKKASGGYRARLNARGYEQVDGQHFDPQTFHHQSHMIL
jgi:hypothetical protein